MTDYRAIPLPSDHVITDRGLTIAVIALDPEAPTVINIGWLPELFALHPMPAAVRAAIAERLRKDADRLESGELEERLRQFSSINQTGSAEEEP